MKDDRFRRAMADIPAATPEQMAVYERQNAARKHYAARRKLIGRVFNAMSLGLSKQFKANLLSQEGFWAADDALWAKTQRLFNLCNVMRDARIAAIKAEVTQS